ncbi:cell division control protein [Entophlyctis luteolus]|nr:cell division control protein [Entophlyctis luteolus]
MPPAPAPDSKKVALTGYVGFDSITSQIERKLLKRGFAFNLMVVGRSGLGKSTLVNTLFASHLVDSKGLLKTNESGQPLQTTEIQSVSHIIEENGVRLTLTITDTPGYGDQVNNDKCWEPVVKYIKDQYSSYLRKELTPTRDRRITDSRVHAVLFFIAPTGHALTPLDINVMRRISEIANVIPVIAKSDSLTIEERAAFKKRIKEEIEFHGIKTYPYADVFVDEDEFGPSGTNGTVALNDEDRAERELLNAIRDVIPFAVVGSEKSVVVDGKAVRGRKTRWGVINVENEEHCEFVALRNFLTRTHMQDLLDVTAMVHYEQFRTKQLLALKEATRLVFGGDMKPRGTAASSSSLNYKSFEREHDQYRDARDARSSASAGGSNPRRHQKKPRSQSLDAASVSAPPVSAPFPVPGDAVMLAALHRLSLGPTPPAHNPEAADSFAMHFPPMATATPHANDLRISPAAPPHVSANAAKPAPAGGWKLVTDMTFSQILARSVAPKSTSTTQTAPFSYAAAGSNNSNSNTSLKSTPASVIPQTTISTNSRSKSPNKSKPKNVNVGTMTNISMGEFFGTGTLNPRIVSESIPSRASAAPAATPLYTENAGSPWKSASPPAPLIPLIQPNIATAAATSSPLTGASVPAVVAVSALPVANSQLNNFIILQQQYQQNLMKAAAEAAAAASLSAVPTEPFITGSSQGFRPKKLSAAAQPFVPSTFDTDSPRRSRDDMVDVGTPGVVTRKLNMQSRHSRKRNDTFDYYYSEDEDHERGTTIRDSEHPSRSSAARDVPVISAMISRHRDIDAMSITSEDSVEFVLNEEGMRSLPGFLQEAGGTASPAEPPASESARSLSARPKNDSAFVTNTEINAVFARHRSVSMDEMSVPPVLAQRSRVGGGIGEVGFASSLAIGLGGVRRNAAKAAPDEDSRMPHATLRGLLLERTGGARADLLTNHGQQQPQSHRRHTHTFQRKQSRGHMRRSLSIADVRRGGGSGVQVTSAFSGGAAETQTPSMTSSPGGSAASTFAVFAGSGSGRFEFSKRWNAGGSGEDSVCGTGQNNVVFGWTVGAPPARNTTIGGGNGIDSSAVLLARTASEPYLAKHRNPVTAAGVPDVLSDESNSTLQGTEMELA